jgi:hypothetical protein
VPQRQVSSPFLSSKNGDAALSSKKGQSGSKIIQSSVTCESAEEFFPMRLPATL